MNRVALLYLMLPLTAILAQPPGGGLGFGPPPGINETRKILAQFDTNQDGWLNNEERQAARAMVQKNTAAMPRLGPPGMFRSQSSPPARGIMVQPEDVPHYPQASLYEPSILRTLFIDFDNRDDWESELEDFHGTDVDVTATITVDGKKYPNVGIRFRGMSSYMGVSRGYKRSLNLSMDLADKDQRLYGYKTLNLLNAHGDASYLSSVLYSHIASQYIPVPKANLVKVVINGENWGIYVNVQQFNKEFLQEHYASTKGARWKVTGSPQARGGLEYLGEDINRYKRIYEIKSKDNDKSWKALIRLCKVLYETPTEQLEEALKPILDIDNVLWFLALDNALINSDGYWVRASDYSIYMDEKGIFHLIPHDMNEAFRSPGGPGMGMIMRISPGDILPLPVQNELRLTEKQRQQLATLQKEADAALEKLLNSKQQEIWKGWKAQPIPGGPANGPAGGPGGGMIPAFGGAPGGAAGGMNRVQGIELDPLIGLNDASKPLRSKLLAHPALRARYLQFVKTIAEKSLDWTNIEPLVTQYRLLIEKEVERDTRKLSSFEEFQRVYAVTTSAEVTPARMGPPGAMNLKSFFDQRRKFLLNYREKK